MRALLLALALPAAAVGDAAAYSLPVRVGPVALKGLYAPMAGPARDASFRFPRAGWLTGYSVRLTDAKGESAEDRGVFCHAAVRLKGPAAWRGGTMPERFHITLAEGESAFAFPAGFGLAVDTTTRYELAAQLQNGDRRNDGAYTFDASFEVVPAGSSPLKTLSQFLVSATGPSAGGIASWTAPRGKSSRASAFEAPATGRVHRLAFHIHRWATKLSLRDAASGAVLFESAVENRADGWPARTPGYSSAEGLPLVAGRRYEFRADFDVPDEAGADEMAVARVYFRPDAE